MDMVSPEFLNLKEGFRAPELLLAKLDRAEYA